MPKPNYSFEKRQRELAKSKKREDKALAKRAGSASPHERAASPQAARPSEVAPADPQA